MTETIPISALQHWAYCPRQCALIHVEQVWDENVYTLRGRRAHERVDAAGGLTRDGRRVEHALPLWHDALGLVGRADAVEFGDDGTPYPVEHKVGSKKKHPLAAQADAVQLCAQALCLEEMFGMPVPEGALFYKKSRRRQVVRLGDCAARSHARGHPQCPRPARAPPPPPARRRRAVSGVLAHRDVYAVRGRPAGRAE